MNPNDAIAKLIQSGLNETAIGGLVGVNQSTINRIRHGQVPTWPLGNALIEAARNAAIGSQSRRQKKVA